MRPPRSRPRHGAWSVLHGPVTALLRGVLTLPLMAGVESACESAATLGRAYARAPWNRKRLSRGIRNLEMAFPEWSVEQRESMAVTAYEHLARLGVEMAYAPRLLSRDAWARHLTVEGGRGAIPRAIEPPGALMLTGHVGNWELCGYMMAMLGLPMHAVYRPLDLEPLDRWVRRTREGRGLIMVSKWGALRALPEAIRAGYPVGFVADQNGGERGVFVPYFGRLASSYKSIAFMAIPFRTRVVCAYASRMSPAERVRAVRRGAFPDARAAAGMAYEFRVLDDFGPKDWESHPDPVFYLTARYRRALEMAVRRSPEQYLWMHRAWRSRPPHERFDRPFPEALKEKLRLLPWMTDAELARIIDQSDRGRAEIRAGRVKPGS